MVPKTNDEIYVSISIGEYIITFHLFSVLYQRRYCCWKYRKWGSHLKNRYHYAKVVENARISFWISPYCTLFFPRNSFASCSLQWRGWMHYECVRISALNTTLDIYLLFENGHKSTQTRCKVCSNLTKCTTTIDFRLTSVFFINLEHLSHPTLVLLFIPWKVKCWLKVRRERFIKIIRWC